MYKIDFYFFRQLLQENLSYTEMSEILKKLPKHKSIFSACYQKFLQRKLITSVTLLSYIIIFLLQLSSLLFKAALEVFYERNISIKKMNEKYL